MFARNSFKVASRAGAGLRPSTLAAPLRSFKTTAIRKDEPGEDHIPVVHYEKGQRVTEDIHVPENSAPFIPKEGDIESKAIPLKEAAYRQLTPTLKKFCLPGKVAVVTG